MYEALKLIVTTLVLPPGGPIVLIVLGLSLLRRYPRFGRVLSITGAVSLWLCSLPIVSSALVTALGGAKPLDPAAARQADAIVILGGGVRPRAPEYGGDTLGRLTLERVRYGALLARQTGLPVLVTGGAPAPDIRAEADLMREVMVGEYGIGVRWVERRSRNTRENARNSADMIAADGLRRVVLVMHGFDVRRARQAYEAAGLDVIAAPTHVPQWDDFEAADFLPSGSALQTTYFCLYEMLALARDAAGRRLAGN